MNLCIYVCVYVCMYRCGLCKGPGGVQCCIKLCYDAVHPHCARENGNQVPTYLPTYIHTYLQTHTYLPTYRRTWWMMTLQPSSYIPWGNISSSGVLSIPAASVFSSRHLRAFMVTSIKADGDGSSSSDRLDSGWLWLRREEVLYLGR